MMLLDFESCIVNGTWQHPELRSAKEVNDPMKLLLCIFSSADDEYNIGLYCVLCPCTVSVYGPVAATEMHSQGLHYMMMRYW